jgi:hypothetical protein
MNEHNSGFKVNKGTSARRGGIVSEIMMEQDKRRRCIRGE